MFSDRLGKGFYRRTVKQHLPGEDWRPSTPLLSPNATNPASVELQLPCKLGDADAQTTPSIHPSISATSLSSGFSGGFQ
jgi:hypothetical protein